MNGTPVLRSSTECIKEMFNKPRPRGMIGECRKSGKVPNRNPEFLDLCLAVSNCRRCVGESRPSRSGLPPGHKGSLRPMTAGICQYCIIRMSGIMRHGSHESVNRRVHLVYMCVCEPTSGGRMNYSIKRRYPRVLSKRYSF